MQPATGEIMATDDAITAPVYLFNCANGVPYTVTINGGPAVVVPATSASNYWYPGTPENPAYLLLAGTTSAGCFNFGDNQLVIQTATVPDMLSVTVNVPDLPMVQIDAGQLYLVFQSYTLPPRWAFLVNGTLVAGNAHVVPPVRKGSA
ncbi:MAG TPA: hypothetical protein VGB24_18565 [Longimicrobium sp.]|uniref:hypothetical protein n=1 Tax=Longimicrobium sp. TaxID=2029185 RepID=UPI002EDA9A03